MLACPGRDLRQESPKGTVPFSPARIIIAWQLRPQMPVEHSIVDRLVQMHRADGVAAVEVGDGAGDAEDLVVGSGGKAHLRHRGF